MEISYRGSTGCQGIYVEIFVMPGMRFLHAQHDLLNLHYNDLLKNSWFLHAKHEEKALTCPT